MLKLPNDFDTSGKSLCLQTKRRYAKKLPRTLGV